jgi:hypothetical protein
MKEEPKRLQAAVFITRYPGQAFHVEVAARRDMGAFEGSLKGDLSSTRFVYWFNEQLPEQLHQILLTGILELWGDELGNLPLDVDAVASVVEEERQRIW